MIFDDERAKQHKKVRLNPDLVKIAHAAEIAIAAGLEAAVKDSTDIPPPEGSRTTLKTGMNEYQPNQEKITAEIGAAGGMIPFEPADSREKGVYKPDRDRLKLLSKSSDATPEEH